MWGKNEAGYKGNDHSGGRDGKRSEKGEEKRPSNVLVLYVGDCCRNRINISETNAAVPVMAPQIAIARVK